MRQPEVRSTYGSDAGSPDTGAVTDVERGLVARYLHRLYTRTELPLRTLRGVTTWLYDREHALCLPLPQPLREAVAAVYAGNPEPEQLEKAIAGQRAALLQMLDTAASETPAPEPVAANVAMLVAEFGLSRAAWKIVGVVACHQRFDMVRNLCDLLSNSINPVPHMIALLVAEPRTVVEHLLSANGDLVANGLIKLKDEGWGLWGQMAIPSRLDACLDQTYAGFADLKRAMLGSPLVTCNVLADYAHVQADRDLVVNVLAGATREGAAGVNILLHGQPGSGKTELSKVAAAAASLSLFTISEHARAGSGEADRAERLATLVFAMRLLKGSRQSAILFDEMEDVAWQFMKRGGSKAYLNRLLETNPVPVLWTSNNISEIDPALLRRMTLCVELKLPPPLQRVRILERLSQRVGVALSEAEIDHLARRVDATPAVFENALKAARYAGGGAAAVEQAALGIQRAAFGVDIRRLAPAVTFVPELICASHDLVELAEQIQAGGKLKFSFCLSGPPGTGKSAFARYLARKLGLEVLHKRASDLLSMYVGQSEQRIAAAFEEAREGKAFLIFDEADSLLFDRRAAQRSWEVTQVNEMLTQMEEHAYPVCFTTNLMDRIDAASLRRFTFNVRFTYLDKTALGRAWTSFFGALAMPADVLALANLTPGDFAQAREQADVMGLSGKAERIAALLADISRTKPGASGTMGFMR